MFHCPSEKIWLTFTEKKLQKIYYITKKESKYL